MNQASRDRVFDAIMSSLDAALDRGGEHMLDSSEHADIASDLTPEDLQTMKEEQEALIRLVLESASFQEKIRGVIESDLIELAYQTRERLGLEHPEE